MYSQTKLWKQLHPVRARDLNKGERERLKIAVLAHYSLYGMPACSLCGFSNIDALCLDHINDNGAQDRKLHVKRKEAAGTTFYRFIKKQGFPPGYQTLCANCNLIKEVVRRRHATNTSSS